MGVLIDAGPLLNFLAIGQENILIQLAKTSGHQLAVCERIVTEVQGVTRDPRFERTAVATKLPQLTDAGHIAVLSDDIEDNAEFRCQIALVTGMPAEERLQNKKSLGEILLIAHACTLVLQGEEVVLLIDEGDGRARANQAKARMQAAGAPGVLRVANTKLVMQKAAENPDWIKKGSSAQQVYDSMRAFDDGWEPAQFVVV